MNTISEIRCVRCFRESDDLVEVIVRNKDGTVFQATIGGERYDRVHVCETCLMEVLGIGGGQ